MSRRVRLVPPKRRDEAEMLALSRVSRAFHRGLAASPGTPEQFARLLAKCRRKDFMALLIRRRSDDAILGVVELSQISRGAFQSACLGYYVGAPFARQGYMTEAMEILLEVAFMDLGLHRVEANIQPVNAASLALATRLGFTREGYSRRFLKIAGRWRDHERWAILAEDWRARARRK